MSKERYSLYDFPELLYNSKLLTNRQRCIVLCLFSFLNLKGGGAFTIDILAEKTGIKKNHIYEEIKNLFVRTPEGEKIEIIKRDGKKILLITDNLRKFIDTKLGLAKSPNTGLKKSQNGTKEVPKQDLESPNMGLNKSQNGTKKFPEAQETQKPEGGVNNIIREDFLDKNNKRKIIEGSNKGTAPEKSESDFEKKEGESLGRNEEITSSLLTSVIQRIIEEFKINYKHKFNRYPLIDSASVKRIREVLLNSASSQKELEEIVNHLIQKIPDFFKLLDKWVMEKGYSFFAFSYRISDLLSQPVSYQATNTPGVEFACKGGWK